MPVFHEVSDTKIFEVSPPPELHRMLGAVNTIINYCNNDDQCKRDIEQWIKECYVEKKVTKKGCFFRGNACKKLLDSVDKLRSKKNIHHIKYVQLLQDLKNVIHDCFGNELKPSFEKIIEHF